MQALKNWMKSNGFTQDALAEKLGIKQPTLSSILKGKTKLDPDYARVIVDQGGITWDELYPSKTQKITEDTTSANG